MALIFSSGGGRLGNQLLNLIHLQAFLFEYDVDIFKVNDCFIISKEKSFIYKLDKNRINWRIVSDYSKTTKILFGKVLQAEWGTFLVRPPKRTIRILLRSALRSPTCCGNLRESRVAPAGFRRAAPAATIQ